MELRWKVEQWEEYRDGISNGIKRSEPPVLQYREREGPKGMGWWSDWKDVPTEFIET